MTDDIEQRLRDTADACVKAYLNWSKNKKDPEIREQLQDTIHEIRKVSARLEIEIAISEREEMAARPIPIPPHRATRKGGQSDDLPDDAGNRNFDDAGDPGQPRNNSSNAVRNGMKRRPHGGHHHRAGGGGNRDE